jgi:hypothetical protein
MSSPIKTGVFQRLLIILYWPVMIFIGLSVSSRNEFYVADDFRDWSLAHLMLHSTPIFLYLVKFRKEFNFPFIEILSAFNIVHFGLPVFFIHLEDYQLGLLSIDALKESFYAYVIFYASFYLFMSSKIKLKGVEFIPKNTSLKAIKYFGYIFLGFYILNATFQVKAIYHIGYVGFFAYLGIFINLWREKLLKQWEKGVFIVIVGYDFIDRALDGLIAPFALLVLFLIICVLMSKSSKWLIGITIFLFVWFYSIFSTVKYDFRDEVWFGGRNYSMFEKVLLIQQLYAAKKLNESTAMVDDYKGKNHILWRFSYQLSAMSLILQETPARVPFWNGESYIPLFSKFIPRFMWPDKPTEGMGYKFGTTYRITSTWNTNTSINTPILTELYMNFGFTGLYVGSFILGFIYFVLVKLFNSKRVSYASGIVGMAIIFPLMIWESNFSLMFGNLLLISFTFIALYRLITYFVKQQR